MRSQTSSSASEGGLCAMRRALKPACLSRRALRSSAAGKAAAQLHGLAVEAEAVLRVGLDGADAEDGFGRVGRFVLRADLGFERVQIGIVDVPQRGRVDRHFQRDGRFFAFARGEGSLRPGDGFARGADDARLNRRFAIQIGRDAIFDARKRAGFIGPRRGHKHVPRLDAHRAARPQERVAIKARAGIPARGALQAVRGDFQLVRAAGAESAGQLLQKRRVAVRVHGQQVAVEIDLGAHIRAVEIENDVPRVPVRAQILDVAAVSAGEKAVGRAAGHVRAARQADGVIVGQVDLHEAVRSRRGQVPAFGDACFAHETPPFSDSSFEFLLRFLRLREAFGEPLFQFVAFDDRVGAHARTAAIAALGADARQVQAFGLDHVRAAFRTSASHGKSLPFSFFCSSYALR